MTAIRERIIRMQKKFKETGILIQSDQELLLRITDKLLELKFVVEYHPMIPTNLKQLNEAIEAVEKIKL